MNINQLMKQAQQMQKKLEEKQKELETSETEGSSGGGMVKITLKGNGSATKISIDPKLIDPEDPEMLEDLIVAAINDAASKNEAAKASAMGDMGGMGLPPGMKLPF